MIPLDGIIFSSVQASGDACNVVLFHKAARVESIRVPSGTVIEARSGYFSNEGYEVEYEVTEEVPPTHPGTKVTEEEVFNSDAVTMTGGRSDPPDSDARDLTRIMHQGGFEGWRV
jgi:hypothetical protein